MERLLEILTDLRPDIDFHAEKNLVADGLLNSFDIISIISEISAEYGVKIEPWEIEASNFNSIEAIKALVDRAIARQEE